MDYLNKLKKISNFFGLFICFFSVAVCPTARGQVFELEPGSDFVTADVFCRALSMASCNNLSSQDQVVNFPFISPLTQLPDGSHVFFLFVRVGDLGGSGCMQRSGSIVYLKVIGLGGPSVIIEWWAHTSARFAYFTCGHEECPCAPVVDADGFASLVANLQLRLTGVPPGTSVPVYYRYEQLHSVSAKSEGGGEDFAAITDANAQVDGFPVTPYTLATSTLQLLQDGIRNQQFTILAAGGQLFNIAIQTDCEDWIADPPIVTPCLLRDFAYADSWGRLELSTINKTACPDEQLFFSLDLGSDSEFSETMNGNNRYFDPGDMYEWKDDSSLPPFVAEFDDIEIFGNDPFPDIDIAASGAPLCTGANQAAVTPLYFDLDAGDRIDLNLDQLTFGPGIETLPFSNSDCIHFPDFMVFSYDEDSWQHYASPACDIPVVDNGFTPVNGSDDDKNEIIQAFTTFNPGSGMYIYFDDQGAGSETEIHLGLSPDPDPNTPGNNDDIDALDIYSKDSQCNFQYFSVDHEATYSDPFLGPLNPGSIYQVLAPGSFAEVIRADNHLGLSNQVDIDAFEFTFLFNPATNDIRLALVFSVDENDFNTPANESGGLSPGALYASFLDGNYFQFSEIVADSNIDALSFGCRAIDNKIDLLGNVIYAINGESVPETNIEISGDFTGAVTTDINGAYSIGLTRNKNFTLTPSKTGDIGSFSITCYDAALTARHAVGLENLNAAQQKAADADENGQVQTFDAALICRYAVGFPPFNPSDQTGEWRFEPENRVYMPLISDQANQNFSATLLGEVDGNWTSNLFLPQELEIRQFLSLEDIKVTPGEILRIPVSVEADWKTLSTFIDLGYNSEILRFMEVQKTPLSEGFTLSVHSERDRLRVGAFNPEPIGKSGDLIFLVFEVTGKPGDRMKLAFNRLLINNDIDIQGTADLFVISPQKPGIAGKPGLFQNHPNPFYPNTFIRFDIPETAQGKIPVQLRIYNSAGQMLKTLVDEALGAGTYTIEWDRKVQNGELAPPGIYFYSIITPGFTATKKMMIIK